MRILNLLLLTVILGCGQSNNFIVKIGNSVLTNADVDSNLAIQEDMRESIVQDWITQNVIYEKALAEKWNENPSIQKQLENFQKQALVQSYLERELSRVTVLASEVETYYRDHASEFPYTDDHVKTEYFWTRDKWKARDVAQKLSSLSRLRKRDFMDIISPMAGDSDVIGVSDYLTRDKFEPRVAKDLFARTAIDEIVGPLQLSTGFFTIWHVLEIHPKKSSKPITEVGPEIEARLRAIKRKEKTEELVKKYRGEVEVTYGTQTKK